MNETNYAQYNHQGLWAVRIGSLVAFALFNSWLIPLEGTSHSHWQHDFLIRLFRLYSLMYMLPFGIHIFQKVRMISLSRFWRDIDQRQKSAALIPMVKTSDTFNSYKPLMIRTRASWLRLVIYYMVICIIVVGNMSLLTFYIASSYNSAPYTLDDSTTGFIKIIAAIFFFVLFLIFIAIAQTSYLNIKANSKVIVVRNKSSFKEMLPSAIKLGDTMPGVIRWGEATAYRKFASRDGTIVYYDLHCANRFIRWTQIKRRGPFVLGKPTLPQQEYEQQFAQLDAIIQMRTGLTCVEI